MKNKDDTFKKYNKWSLIHTVALICFAVLFIVNKILIIVDEFADLTSLAYTVYTWVSTATAIADFILIIICEIKIRKIKKLIGENKDA